MNVEHLIETLTLRPHPEGGYFRETYRATDTIAATALPARFPGARQVSTAIYYLLQGNQVSRFHRIQSDEVWHFYAGDTLLVHVLGSPDRLTTLRLGSNLAEGDRFQLVVPAGAWFAAELRDPQPERFALVGCTVAPGFDFADFELADGEALTAQYPRHADLIRRLTRHSTKPGAPSHDDPSL